MSLISTDTSESLWENYYKVRLPYLQSRSIEDIRRTGVVITGIPAIDNDIQNQWITTMMPIATMAEHYKEGTPIKVVSESDVKVIYEQISHHIHAWRQRLERGVNLGDAPIDDLILLDRFANTIYEHAKYQFTPEIANSIIAQHLNSVQLINAHNFFSSDIMSNLNKGPNSNASVNRINTVEEEEEDPYPDRESLGDFFKNRLINLRRY